MNQQTTIPLNQNTIGLDDWIDEENQLLIHEIRYLIEDNKRNNILFFWGERHSGKSHLLEATNNEANTAGNSVELIKLKQGTEYLQTMIFQPNSLYLIDDVHLIADSASAQQNLMMLYEKSKTHHGRMILSAAAPLSEIPFHIEDLRSRLSSGGTFKLMPLDEQNLYQTFQRTAFKKGIRLDDNVMSYIRTHCRRDSVALFALLEKLDTVSLQTQRKVTIPFIKTLL